MYFMIIHLSIIIIKINIKKIDILNILQFISYYKIYIYIYYISTIE